MAVSSRLSFRQSSPSRANYALLCRLLIDGGNQALNLVFSKIYPPLTLTENLSKPQVQKTLRRLKNQGTFFSVFVLTRRAVHVMCHDTKQNSYGQLICFLNTLQQTKMS